MPVENAANSLRILYHHRTLADGAEGIHIREMVTAFRNLGHEVRVVSILRKRAGLSSFGSPGPLESMKKFLPRVTYEAAELAYNYFGQKALASAIREFQPHFIYDRYNTFCNAALKAARQARIPVFLEVNAPLAHERETHDRGLVFSDLAKRIERETCQSVDHVFAVSTPLRDYLINEQNVSPKQITVLPNGANPDFFRPQEPDNGVLRKELELPLGTIIGFAGIFRPWHGVELLCSAFKQIASAYPDSHLLLVGDGPLEAELRRELMPLLQQGRVTFTGRVSHERVRDYLRSMDVAVSPGATFYASPMKILEYMAMGIPTVAPDMPNIRDLVDSGCEAVLFEPANENSLACSLKKLIESPALRSSIGISARKKVVRELNWERNAARVVAHFYASKRNS